MSIATRGQVTLLPAQLSYLATLADKFDNDGGAIGLSQIGSIIFIQTGGSTIKINSRGEVLTKTKRT